jgi:hypothetical protein
MRKRKKEKRKATEQNGTEQQRRKEQEQQRTLPSAVALTRREPVLHPGPERPLPLRSFFTEKKGGAVIRG